MLDFRKKLPRQITTNDGMVLVSLAAALDYAHQKKTPAWNWARRQLTRAAMSDDAADMTAAFAAVQSAVFMDGMRAWRKSA